MSKKITLSKAVNLMKEGSKKGFKSFFEATVSYSYNLALYLFEDDKAAKAFLEDFYIYLYLHIGNYRGSGDEKAWLSRQMIERYKQLSIGRQLKEVDLTKKIEGNVELPYKESAAILSSLMKKINFPPEEKRGISPKYIILALLILISVGVLISLFVMRASSVSEKPAGENGIYIPDAGTEDADENGEADNADDNGATVTTINVIHDNENSGETVHETLDSPDTPTAPSVEAPDVAAPQVDTPQISSPQIGAPQVNEPATDVPSGSSDTRIIGDDHADRVADDAESAIDDFLKEVEEFENFDISD